MKQLCAQEIQGLSIMSEAGREEAEWTHSLSLTPAKGGHLWALAVQVSTGGAGWPGAPDCAGVHMCQQEAGAGGVGAKGSTGRANNAAQSVSGDLHTLWQMGLDADFHLQLSERRDSRHEHFNAQSSFLTPTFSLLLSAMRKQVHSLQLQSASFSWDSWEKKLLVIFCMSQLIMSPTSLHLLNILTNDN